MHVNASIDQISQGNGRKNNKTYMFILILKPYLYCQL